MKKVLLTLCCLCMVTLTAFAQKQKITGTVTDEQNEPLIGVSVKVVGSSLGTVTDLDGNYAIEASKGQSLEFSYIGYKPQTVKVSKDVINVTLGEDNSVLDEVIVTGYGAVARKNLTTSIVKVKGDDVIKTGTTNMSQMLLGRAAGLQATMSSAQPGGGVSMTVRGGGEPLYVVDGVVMPTSSLEGTSGGSVTSIPTNINRSGLADINPDDIESIEVLKDASAAIYGVNAANGVILITTKKGKQGKMKVTYDGSVSLVSNYEYLQPLGAQDYMKYVNIYKKDQYLYNHQMAPYGPNAYDGGNTDVFSASDIASATTTNWLDEVLRNGSISSHNVNIQGGTDKLQYYLAGNYYKQVGTVKASDFERYVLRANIAAQVFDWLKVTTTMNYNKNRNNNGMVGGTSSGRGTQANGSLASAMSFPSYQPVYNEDGSYNTMSSMFNNPAALNTIEDLSRTDGFYTNIALDFTILPGWLTARGLYGYNKETSNRDIYIPTDVYYDQVMQSRGSMQRIQRDNSTLEGTVSFDHSFWDEAFTLNAVVGMGRYFTQSESMGVSYYDNYDAIGNDNIGLATGTITPSSTKAKSEKRSQFGRLNLDFFDRYSVSATLRRDGTDKFFEGKKYAWFPSVAAAWKIHNEKFMKDVNWVNMLKLRASYGVTGRDNLGATLYGGYTVRGLFVKFDNNNTTYAPIVLSSVDYPNVTWEKTIMKNIGLDFSILKDRINGSFDYFVNDITDQLGSATAEGLSMFGSYPVNGAHVRRYGWDATINTVNVKTKDFQWNTMLTLSHYNSIYKERFPNYDYKEYQQREDEPVNALYFYRTGGIINSDKSNMPSYQPADMQYPGMPIIKDLNGDGEITVEDVDMVNVVPSLYWGLSNTLNYKNWDLTVFIYSQLGLKKYNYSYDWATHPISSVSANASVLTFDSYNSETNPNGTLPGVAFDEATYSLPAGAGTDLHYESASFVRVRNITLGYTFNGRQLGSFGKYVSSLRLYADAQNPFTFTSFKNFDPEVVTGGSYKGGKAEYPMTRTYSFGVKIQF